MPKIVLKNKAEILREYTFGKKEVYVGRNPDNDIIVDDKSVSEKHCVLRYGEGGLEVEDLDSAFGTVVNGANIKKQQVVPDSEIRLGSHSLVLKDASGKGPGGKESAYLLGVQGKMEGRKYELMPETTRIGRSEEFNEICISKDFDKSVSRRHATIVRSGNDFTLTDKRSKNRTFVNQKQVGKEDEIKLENRDEILIGKSIFRFMIGEKEDYSLPKKAGVFWVRFFPKFKKLLMLLITAGSVFSIYKGYEGISVLGQKAPDINLKGITWSPEGLGFTGYEDDMGVIDITPSPSVGDINGDGTNEVVMSAASGKVYSWFGNSGRLMWYKSIGTSQLTSPSLADINNDGILDIVVGSDDSKVYVLDGISGELIYISDFLGGKISYASSPLVKDLNDDGFRDIVVTTDDRVVCFLYSPASGAHKPYQFRTPEDILSSPVYLGSDRTKGYIAVGTNGGKIYLFNAANPENREVVDITSKINMMEGVDLVLNEISSVPAAADLNGDGTDDLVFTTSSYYIVAMDGSGDHAILWTYKIRPYSTLDSPIRYSSPAITRFDDKNQTVVALGWANGRVLALDGASGELLWKYSIGDDTRILSSVVVADFNKDKLMDFVFINEQGKILIVKGGVHSQNDMLLGSYSISKEITSTPVIADINGDGYLEMLASSMKDSMSMLGTSTRVFKNQIIWGSFRADEGNSGSFFSDQKEKTQMFFAYMIGGALLIIITFLTVLVRKKKRVSRRPGAVNIK
ncbi:MAG: FHA domain-containing protein [Elusimicrobia bacterium]|nr:FHA domain-containing protein [Elusimicrobiota bacterium]